MDSGEVARCAPSVYIYPSSVHMHHVVGFAGVSCRLVDLHLEKAEQFALARMLKMSEQTKKGATPSRLRA